MKEGKGGVCPPVIAPRVPQVSGDRNKGISRGLEPVVHCVDLTAYHSIEWGSRFPTVESGFDRVQGVLSRDLIAAR